uniref:Ig-like domain-containing protein n=1 Tax=Pelusios castaneus TaxID=367368 RepID=A0A8C8RFI4_9SAUR
FMDLAPMNLSSSLLNIFTVIGPAHPITAVVGEDILLPCHLSPSMSAEKMEVRWFRPEFTSFVHLYQDGKDQYGQQTPDYHERTELLKDGIMDGNVVLRIISVRLSDEGKYRCLVRDGDFSEEAVLVLKVTASGSAPHIFVEGHQDGGIRVVCHSAGWYPKPEVVWKDPSGKPLSLSTETKSEEERGFFEIKNSIIIKENSNQNLSCSVKNTQLNQEKESITFYISGQLLPKPQTFKVIGPARPITATVGQDIVLPCHLSPSTSAENMEVRWFRDEFTPYVHLYQHRKDQYEQQMPDYQGRTELWKGGILDGNVPLKIVNIRPSDEGQYRCFVEDGAFYEEAVLELKVEASGSAPQISVEGHQDGGIRMVCHLAGWYPEPEVLWRDLRGQPLSSFTQTKSKDERGLFEIKSSIVVTENSKQSLSCSIRSRNVNLEREPSTFYISGQLPPKLHIDHLSGGEGIKSRLLNKITVKCFLIRTTLR